MNLDHRLTAIPPGQAPCGFVFRLTADDELIARESITAADLAAGVRPEEVAHRHGEAAARATAAGRRVMLAIFDGDTGDLVHVQVVEP